MPLGDGYLGLMLLFVFDAFTVAMLEHLFVAIGNARLVFSY